MIVTTRPAKPVRRVFTLELDESEAHEIVQVYRHALPGLRMASLIPVTKSIQLDRIIAELARYYPEIQ